MDIENLILQHVHRAEAVRAKSIHFSICGKKPYWVYTYHINISSSPPSANNTYYKCLRLCDIKSAWKLYFELELEPVRILEARSSWGYIREIDNISPPKLNELLIKAGYQTIFSETKIEIILN